MAGETVAITKIASIYLALTAYRALAEVISMCQLTQNDPTRKPRCKLDSK